MEKPDEYKHKSVPYAHQQEVFKKSRDREHFALLMEQGTGKSKVIIDTAAYLWGKGRINTLVVIAPNGVHINWKRNEVPTHMPDYVLRREALWTATPTKQAEEDLKNITGPGPELRILYMNIEALSTKRGALYLEKVLKVTDALVAIDESSRIKTPSAVRTKTILKLQKHCKYRRIATGTPITKSPFDAFAQMNFLSDEILGISSFVVFKSRYARLLDASSPLIAKIMRSGARFMPQIVAEDKEGRPVYQNLDELNEKISEHSFRILKKDCLDLPEKLYTKHYYEMEPRQSKIYNDMRKHLKAEMNGKESVALNKLTMVMRLQQITSGYFIPDEASSAEDIYADPLDNPKIKALLEKLEEIEGKVIVWCRFVHEINDVAHALEKTFGARCCAKFMGATKKDERADIIKDFQENPNGIRFFVGTAAAGGIGITLTAASTVIYYTNTFNLEDRLQSEDRAHRIGQRNNVLYIDLECLNTLDGKIIDSLRGKKHVADMITGDPTNEWI